MQDVGPHLPLRPNPPHVAGDLHQEPPPEKQAYAAAREVPVPNSMTIAELDEFTYWLFKYRIEHCDKARVALDTKRGLLMLQEARRRPRGRPGAGLGGGDFIFRFSVARLARVAVDAAEVDVPPLLCPPEQHRAAFVYRLYGPVIPLLGDLALFE